MVFSSGVFLFLFLPVLLVLYYSVKSRPLRNYILLTMSLMFYAWGEPVFVFIMLASIVLNWRLALNVRGSKKLLAIAIGFDVLLLGVFKYAGFITENLGLSRVNIALPIGISFFTFQMMSYVFDVYYGKSEAQKNPLYVALYISFFPQLIAGPIVRYSTIEAEIVSRTESLDGFAEGVRRFIYGLGKKVMLANFLAQIADNAFGFTVNPSVMMSWLGAAAYTLQIYYDFSGYSDMAIGLGLMFGFHFEENFRYPYIASGIREFWSRWHISLSSWFRDYVYIPMGGNRVRHSRLIMNLFTVWLLTGIWHGANWTFILWGMSYFVLLVIERETGRKAGHVLTMLAVILLWVLFRSDSVVQAVSYWRAMFGLNGNPLCGSAFMFYVRNGALPVLSAAVLGVFPLSERLKRWQTAESLWLCFVFVLSVCEVVGSSYNPFIYFNF